MKKIFSFLLLIAVCLNSLDLFAGSSRLWIAEPAARSLYSRYFSSNRAIVPTRPPTSRFPTSLLSGYRSANLFRSLSNQAINQTSRKWPVVPSVIAATLVLFETKHLINSYYNETVAKKAAKDPENLDLKSIIELAQNTSKGKEYQHKLKMIQTADSLSQILESDGPEKFLYEILTKYRDHEGDKFRHSPEYKDIFKKLAPEEKEKLLETIKEQTFNRENEYEALTTDPGWLWGRRPKTEKLSFDENRAVQHINKELEILNETKNIIERS